jgi:putative transcriptional regulator
MMAVLEKKREVTRFQILVEVAASQPQLKQSQIADTIGITPQAVSEYIKDLIAEGLVTSSGRGQYVVTPLGVESIIDGAKELGEYSRHVLSNVVGQVSVWAAIADCDLKKDETVYLSMRDGLLYASLTGDGAMGKVVEDTISGTDVGVAGLKGLIPLDTGSVTIIKIPQVSTGGSHRVDLERLKRSVNGLIGVSGIEPVAAANSAGIKIDIRFGTVAAIADAAIRGVDCTLILTEDAAPQAIQSLESVRVGYNIVNLCK